MNATSRWVWIAVALLLATMAGLMWQPIHEESATVDEPLILAAGYTYCRGDGFRMHPDEPPLAKLWTAWPLLAMDVSISSDAENLLNGSAGFPQARTWSAAMKPVEAMFPAGRSNWYYWPWFEGELFGQLVVYGDNDADRLLVTGRLMQVVLTLLTGVLLFLWANELAGTQAGLLALTMWCFNPVALAHGHLIQTDAGGTLTIVAALWACGRFLTQPTRVRAIVAGVGFGVALATKISAVLLLPAYATLMAVRLFRPLPGDPTARDWLRDAVAFAVSAYAVLLVVYAPHWSPPPPLVESQAITLDIPGWFRILRVFLVPPDFFKAVALAAGSATGGHNVSYLFGKWSIHGWWYYYPVALCLKSPIAWLILSVCGLALFARQLGRIPIGQLVPWVGTAVFLGITFVNRWDIGVRHLLPVYALLPVGVAAQVATRARVVRIAGWILCGWMTIVALCAHPFYIEYFNEFAGGSKNGYRYLLDSNLDWGQDVKRLERYLHQHGIQHVYLDYFGAQRAVDYYGISNTRVSSKEARQIRDGILVVSAMKLMRPEWNWLRQQQQPVDRVGYTLFIYQLAK